MIYYNKYNKHDYQCCYIINVFIVCVYVRAVMTSVQGILSLGCMLLTICLFQCGSSLLEQSGAI